MGVLRVSVARDSERKGTMTVPKADGRMWLFSQPLELRKKGVDIMVRKREIGARFDHGWSRAMARVRVERARLR